VETGLRVELGQMVGSPLVTSSDGVLESRFNRSVVGASTGSVQKSAARSRRRKPVRAGCHRFSNPEGSARCVIASPRAVQLPRATDRCCASAACLACNDTLSEAAITEIHGSEAIGCPCIFGRNISIVRATYFVAW
jgi:hypothetical protein